MSQSPALTWEPAPTALNQEPAGSASVEVKAEDFGAAVERVSREQIAAIKMSHDQTRLNKAVTARVDELVAELGLPPKRTEEQNIDTLCESKLDEFENQRLNFLAEKKAREIFFDKHPEMKTQERKQNVQEATQAMSEALMGAFLRFLRDENQADARREAREAARTKKA